MGFWGFLFLQKEYTYSSHRSYKDLRNQMEAVFKKSAGFDFSVNMVGKFINAEEFEIEPKYQLMIIKGPERSSAYVSGKIVKQEGKSEVIIKVRPNILFVLLIRIAPIVGAGLIINYMLDSSSKELLNLGLIFTFLVPVVAYVIACVLRNNLRNRVITKFNLEEKFT